MVEPLRPPDRPLPGSAGNPLGPSQALDEWTWEADDPWMRVYHVHPAYDPHAYRTFGPLNRFDPHEPGADGSPHASPSSRGALYFARDLECGIVESHPGQRPDVALCPYSRAFVAVPRRPVLLLDLRGNASMAIGALTTLGSGQEPRGLTQAWARAIYEDLPQYDGVLYRGAHQGGDCLAVWERAGEVDVLDDVDLGGTLATRTVTALRKVRRAPLWIDADACPDCARAGLVGASRAAS